MAVWTADSAPPFEGGVTADSPIYLANGAWTLDNGQPTQRVANVKYSITVPGIGTAVFNAPCSVAGPTIFP